MWNLNCMVFFLMCHIFYVMPLQVTLFGPRNIKPKKLQISSHCQIIPKEISTHLRYVHTSGNCILLWEDEHCRVNSMPIVTKDNEKMPGKEI